MTSEAQPAPRRTVKHGARAWFGPGPRRHGEPVLGRSVSYIELFYDLVYVVLVGQAAHAMAVHPGWRAAADFGAVFGLIWIAWVNGTLYHELHGREDGRSRTYIFAQMCVLAVIAVFVGYAGNVDGHAFALSYVVLLVLLTWQWYEVRRRDLPEHKSTSTPYIAGLLATIVVMLATAWLPDAVRVALWWCVVVGWVVLGSYGLMSRNRTLRFFQATDSVIERLALFVIIVLGETVVGVVNGITATEQDALTIVTGVLALIVGFGIWWNYFDIVGVREPREERGRLTTWLFGHLVQCAAIAGTGAAMVGLVAHAHSDRTPTAVAWTLGIGVAVSLLLVAVQSSTVTREPDELRTRTLAAVFCTGALLALVVAAFAPPAWLMAVLMIAVLSATWSMTFVPPAR